MNTQAIVVAIVSSVLSGIVGVLVSSWFYARSEKKRIKIETAKKLFGNKHNMSGSAFQEAMNEVLIVFSDSDTVVKEVLGLFTVIETPRAAGTSSPADKALIKLMKSICTDIGIKYKNLPDSYYLKFFQVSK